MTRKQRTKLPMPAQLYRPRFVRVLVQRYQSGGYDITKYHRWFWRSNTFASDRAWQPASRDRWIARLLYLVAFGVLATAGLLAWLAYNDGWHELYWFAAAFVVGLPVLLALLLPAADMLYQLAAWVLNPKKLGRAIVCAVLERQVRQLRRTYDFRVIAVAGSMGKSSTKTAIARVLEGAGLRVRWQHGNYNDRVTVPLVVFGHSLPPLLHLPAWVRIWRRNTRIIKEGYPYDVVVAEIGTDAPGQIAEFSYLKPDIAVITAIAPEHMEQFGSLDAVAREELSIAPHAKQLLINADDTATQYLPTAAHQTYSVADRTAAYFAEVEREEPTGQELNFYRQGKPWMTQYVSFLGTQGRKIVLAAAAAADMAGVEPAAYKAALTALQPMPGRMQLLKGVNGTTLIDDTYNAAPAAVEAALAVLHTLPAEQRIAVLGNMNELGDFSPEAHRTVGASIDPDAVSLVVTIGKDAKDYLAPAAEANGCRVRTAMSPYEAADILKDNIKPGAAVLFKGSQNGVFAEETLKPFLADKADEAELVRQSEAWLAVKQKQFKR